MRPDVAAAFDRMAGAASPLGDRVDHHLRLPIRRRAGTALRPAPGPSVGRAPGTSLHRCATELDLGPPSAYGWLAANAPRFGFLKRYSWEPWHFGFVRGPAPCSAAGDSVGATAGRRRADGLGRRAPGIRPDPLPRPDPRRRLAMERLGRRALGPAPGRVQLQPLRRLGSRRAGDRPVHARDRSRLRPSKPVRRARRDRRPGPPDVGPAATSSAPSPWRSPPTTPAPRRSPPATASPRSPRPRPTSPDPRPARRRRRADGPGARGAVGGLSNHRSDDHAALVQEAKIYLAWTVWSNHPVSQVLTADRRV